MTCQRPAIVFIGRDIADDILISLSGVLYTVVFNVVCLFDGKMCSLKIERKYAGEIKSFEENLKMRDQGVPKVIFRNFLENN